MANGFLIFWGILILLAGGCIGFVICRLTLGKQLTVAQQQELENSKAQLDDYKSQVNQHFTESAALMKRVASSYQELYTHMAGQSQALLGDTDADALPFAQLQTPSEKKREEPPLKEAAQEVTEDTTQEAAEQTKPEALATEVTEESGETAAKKDAEK